jgi:hypothetical protein
MSGSILPCRKSFTVFAKFSASSIFAQFILGNLESGEDCLRLAMVNVQKRFFEFRYKFLISEILTIISKKIEYLAA